MAAILVRSLQVSGSEDGRQNFNTHKRQKTPARQYFRFQAGENGAEETNKSTSQQQVN